MTDPNELTGEQTSAYAAFCNILLINIIKNNPMAAYAFIDILTGGQLLVKKHSSLEGLAGIISNEISNLIHEALLDPGLPEAVKAYAKKLEADNAH